MSNPCCANSARVLKGDGWACSECGTLIVDNQMDLFTWGYGNITPKEKVCDCGGDKTYGTKANLHTHWCSKNK